MSWQRLLNRYPHLRCKKQTEHKEEAVMKKYLLPHDRNWYRANMHCHSTCSDGHLTPEQLKEAYKGHGYSILAITDHEILLDH